jgi:hypothetical protein
MKIKRTTEYLSGTIKQKNMKKLITSISLDHISLFSKLKFIRKTSAYTEIQTLLLKLLLGCAQFENKP